MNTIEDGICRTILATYHKVGTCNVFEHNFPAVMEVYESERDDRGLLVQGDVHSGVERVVLQRHSGSFPGSASGIEPDIEG